MRWLQDRRKQLGYTQEDLARMLQIVGYDVGRSSSSQWETGIAPAPIGDALFVNELATILRIDVVTLLSFCNYDVKTSMGEIAGRVARLVDTMPPDKQELALRIIEVLLE
jgi:transcriptional regulator with XRE-family HTH domain